MKVREGPEAKEEEVQAEKGPLMAVLPAGEVMVLLTREGEAAGAGRFVKRPIQAIREAEDRELF